MTGDKIKKDVVLDLFFLGILKLIDRKKKELDTNQSETIKIVLPRKFGNTTLAVQLQGYYKKSVLLSSLSETLKRAKQLDKKTKTSLIIALHKIRSKAFEVVIVDDSRELSSNEVNMVYSLNSKFFIFIG